MQDSPSNRSISEKFTAKHRLLRKDSFDSVLHAEKISGKYFKIFFSRNSMKNARLGIIASKRILPRAVDRNYVKRKIRQAFRQHNIKERELDIVVMVAHAYAQQHDAKSENLELLFSRVDKRCAEL